MSQQVESNQEIETGKLKIERLLQSQRSFFNSHQTKDITFRLDALKKLKKTILKYEKKILDALWQDLHKSLEEAYLTEVTIVLQEIDNHLKHLKNWSRAETVPTPIYLFPSKSKIVTEPLGVSLIIAPWNYPFQLLMNPLVGSIAAGNCAILKPSPDAACIAKVMEELILEAFPSNYNCVIQGDRIINELLLKQHFDIIFFTGSSAVGKIIMKAAAANLTPVVLELGGKSPCIVDKDANLDIAAKRIAWGKTINAGQTCIAPDYLFVHEDVKEELLKKIGLHIEKMYGKEIKSSKFYPRIINQRAVERLQKLMLDGKIIYGGNTDIAENFIEPTIIDEIKSEHPIMQEEIFGPILPVLSFQNLNEVIDYVNSKEKPLACYFFGNSSQTQKIVTSISAGGMCINDTIMHVANHHLPFGGVGNSGIGKYHGKQSFLAFSNQKAVVYASTWIDLPMKYPPFKYFNFIKKFI